MSAAKLFLSILSVLAIPIGAILFVQHLGTRLGDDPVTLAVVLFVSLFSSVVSYWIGHMVGHRQSHHSFEATMRMVQTYMGPARGTAPATQTVQGSARVIDRTPGAYLGSGARELHAAVDYRRMVLDAINLGYPHFTRDMIRAGGGYVGGNSNYTFITDWLIRQNMIRRATVKLADGNVAQAYEWTTADGRPYSRQTLLAWLDRVDWESVAREGDNFKEPS